MDRTIAPGIFYDKGGGYVLRGWPSRISITRLREEWKAVAVRYPVMMRRQGKSKLFYFEGPKESVAAILRVALRWRFEKLGIMKEVNDGEN